MGPSTNQAARGKRRRSIGNDTGQHINTTSALTGKFRDETGDRLTPTHTLRHGRRLQYYDSNRFLTGKTSSAKTEPGANGWRLPAPAFEQMMARVVAEHPEAQAVGQTVLIAPEARTAGMIEIAAKTLGACLRGDDKRLLAPVAVSWRSKCSFRPACFRKRRGFSLPMLSDSGGGY